MNLRVAVMQPYFLPYAGYFQLIDAVDVFVVFDDVNYIRRGWINRNNILLNQEKHLFTLSVKKASPNRHINQHELGEDKEKLISLLENAYKKAPQFKANMPWISDIVKYEATNLSDYIQHSIESISAYLKLDAQFIRSSDVAKDTHLRGQDKILAICKELGAGTYINPPGGVELYEYDVFKKANIDLQFLSPCMNAYPQFGNEFIAGLSIVDMIMFNDADTCNALIKGYCVGRA